MAPTRGLTVECVAAASDAHVTSLAWQPALAQIKVQAASRSTTTRIRLCLIRFPLSSHRERFGRRRSVRTAHRPKIQRPHRWSGSHAYDCELFSMRGTTLSHEYTPYTTSARE